MSVDHYDLIVIGTGPGGASLAHRLASTGKRILLLERGDYLPRETGNWSSDVVFVQGRYQARETWFDGDGRQFHPGLHYYVGGNSKVYGAALFRLRERDFAEVRHVDGCLQLGLWPMTNSSPTTRKPRRSFMSMASAGRIRTSRDRAARFPFRPSHTSRASRR